MTICWVIATHSVCVCVRARVRAHVCVCERESTEASAIRPLAEVSEPGSVPVSPLSSPSHRYTFASTAVETYRGQQVTFGCVLTPESCLYGKTPRPAMLTRFFAENAGK